MVPGCAKASEGGDTAVEHTNAYMCVCRCLCVFVCVFVCVLCVSMCKWGQFTIMKDGRMPPLPPPPPPWVMSVQISEGPFKNMRPPKNPGKRMMSVQKSTIIYICVCLCVFVCVCLCVCVYVSPAPAERASNIRGAVQKSETPRPPKRAMTVQKSAPLLRSF